MKYGGSVIFTVMLFVMLHLMVPPELVSETPESSLSVLALRLGFPVTAVIWGVAAYSCVAFVFLRIEERIPGGYGLRGLRYGVAVASLWLLGYVMCAAKSKVPFIGEFIGGLCDAIPVVVLGWLLSRFAPKKEVVHLSYAFNARQSVSSVVIFMLVFFSARAASYWLNLIDVGFRENAAYALAWAMIMGICVGIFYLLLGKAMKQSSLSLSAAKFGVVLFGLTWGIFILFFPLMLKGHLANTMLMFLMDTLSVSAAYYLAELRCEKARDIRQAIEA